MKRRHREVVGTPIPEATPDGGSIPARRRWAARSLGPEPDGLGGWFHRLPEGKSVIGPDPKSGRGQYWIVLGRVLDYGRNGLLLGIHACSLSPEEAPFTAKAGVEGLEILALQFPRENAGWI